MTTLSPKKLWIEALRSGKYKQGYGFLCKAGNYCCLGVACEVYQEHVGDLRIEDLWSCKMYDGESKVLPEKISKWLGLVDAKGSCKYSSCALTTLNDAAYKFEEIARILEKNDSYFVT